MNVVAIAKLSVLCPEFCLSGGEVVGLFVVFFFILVSETKTSLKVQLF